MKKAVQLRLDMLVGCRNTDIDCDLRELAAQKIIILLFDCGGEGLVRLAIPKLAETLRIGFCQTF